MQRVALSFLFALLMSCGFGAYADVPKPWQMGFQEPATPVMEKINDLHNLLLVIICVIGVFVCLVLGYILFRYKESRNPVPSKTTHHTLLEIVWTAIPVLILVVIAFPSFRLMFFMDKVEEPQMTLKVTSYQWYWNYEYPDHGIKFDSYMVEEADLKEGQPRLLAVDHEIVIPVDTPIKVLMTSADVIHSWAVPAFGVKKDCVPGRDNESWINVKKEGIYYGQCSELCGVKHGFMPIAVRAVSKEAFKAWAEEAKTKFANLSFTVGNS